MPIQSESYQGEKIKDRTNNHDLIVSLNGTDPGCDIRRVLFHKRPRPAASHSQIDER